MKAVAVFVQIGDENIHRVGVIMDEVFGAENRMATISYATTGASSASTLSEVADYLLWYAKDRKLVKYRAALRVAYASRGYRIVQLARYGRVARQVMSQTYSRRTL